MAVILKEEDAKEWIYKGEGAANIVLSYNGSSRSLVGKVLRIQKVLKDEGQSANGCVALTRHEKLLWEDIEELVESTSKEVAEQVFVKRVMSPLLDPMHIDFGIRIAVSRQFLVSVEKNVHNQRPAWRVEVAGVDTLCDSALLISDHSVFPSSKGTLVADLCFAVEIKPKCGFLPSSEFISKRNAIKKRITRYEMHQFLKLKRGEISHISKYDPLDLFSGSKSRINQAIEALFATPENNFRIFLNGSLVFGGLGGSMDNASVSSRETKEKLEALIKISGLQLSSFLELVAEALYRSAVLDKLLAAQKLDHIDIEGAIHLYYNITSQPCMVCKNTSDAELLHLYSRLHSLSLKESLKIVREYLIATTAKDCSLMVSFRPSENGSSANKYNSVLLKSCNQSFDYKANFIDLDMKPLEKMVHYYELDMQIVDYYKRILCLKKLNAVL
ncbi:inositol-pentakisphosphate 2-kinase IPK1-like [Iris pallida]|uniref:Inositol-pentakisphosphate 2-kinase n=1 Tax=Iris pallida TaxID=29817 RepID=A0AAX6EW73_IRIPA|nr:inositol-pentakisphosphate 2-kinase IPK1-like [Iris pallida]